MQKVKGKVHATLTELKNMIGDVLAAVDENGEVILTSYNKAKYRIEKIRPQIGQSEEPEQSDSAADQQATAASPVLMPPPTTHHEQQAEMVELAEAIDDIEEEQPPHPAMIMPTPFATAPVEQLGETDGDTVTHSLTIEEVTEVMSQDDSKVPTPSTPPADLFSLWSNLSDGELWQRSNPLEIRWAQVARNLI